MRKLTMLSVVVGAVMFVASNASAVMGTITLSATSKFTLETNDTDSIKSYSVSQKNLLFILEQGTGDTSITNKPTKIYYDPDAYNALAVAWENTEFASNSIYGIFYYSNSVSGLVRLDGTNVEDNTTNYYSYIELDFVTFFGYDEGFYNPDAMPSTSVISDSHGEAPYTAEGTAILYVHSDPSQFNLLGNWRNDGGFPPYYYDANDDQYNVDDFTQDYAAIIQGPVKYTLSFSAEDEKESESITLKGSGDVDYDDEAGIISGTVTFSGKGPDELP